MKKLMIAVAIVCAAAVSQAVSVNWGFGGKVYLSGNGVTSQLATSAGAPAVGADAALCLIYVGTSMTTFELGAGGTLAEGQTLVDSIAYGVKSTGPVQAQGSWNPATKSTDLTGYADKSAFAIVFYDGKKYDYLYTVDTSNGLVGDAVDTAVTYNDLSGKTALSTQYGMGGSAVAGAINVPEPTSGLLLLLGVAGMALKRKRA